MPEKLYSIKESTMTDMADTIRQLTGTTGPITGEEIGNYVVTNLPNSENLDEVLEDQDDIIAQIQTALQGKAAGGGVEPILQEKTVDPSTSSQTVKPDSGYDGLDTVTVNAMPTAIQAIPSISINSSTGLITATATQTAGYVTAGTKSSTYQMAFQPAQTITPGTTNKTIAANTYLGGIQTIKGDANLVASNIVSGKSIFGVVGTATTGGSGDTSAEDGIITGNISGAYTNDRVTTVGGYAFYNYSSLTTANFPKVTTIGGYAFYNCRNLATVSFPLVTTVGSSAFDGCHNLATVSFPLITTIGNYVFCACDSLTTVSFPKVTTIGNYAFDGCSNLATVSFPLVTSVGSSAFRNCDSLTTVSFPKVTTIGSGAFYNCRNLATVSFPLVTSVGSSTFYDCFSLTTVSFPKATTIGSGAFKYCSNLVSIYLRGTTVCKLSNSAAFSYTGIWSNKGSIFVPTSLVSAYKSSTNWVFFSARIFGI